MVVLENVAMVLVGRINAPPYLEMLKFEGSLGKFGGFYYL